MICVGDAIYQMTRVNKQLTMSGSNVSIADRPYLSWGTSICVSASKVTVLPVSSILLASKICPVHIIPHHTDGMHLIKY